MASGHSNGASTAGAAAIVCELTPRGRGAVASVLLRGAHAEKCVADCCRRASGRSAKGLSLNRIVLCRWGESEGGGEAVVVCRRAEDQFEIHPHGGTAAVDRIIADLVAAGCRRIAWPELVQEEAADPAAAEARVQLARVSTARAAAILLDQHRGALGSAMNAAAAAIARGDRVAAEAGLKRLLDRGELGIRLTRGWKIVLAGPPNAGKSSLINALVGYERSIVFDLPGTTRDIVTAAAAVDGWPVEFSDTAGLSAARADAVEQEGIRRAEERLQRADVVVLVFDAAAPWGGEQQRLISRFPAALLVHNKCDLPAADPASRPPGEAVSAVTGRGLPDLLQSIARRIAPDPPRPGEAVPFTESQVNALTAALKLLKAGDLSAAAAALHAIT